MCHILIYIELKQAYNTNKQSLSAECCYKYDYVISEGQFVSSPILEVSIEKGSLDSLFGSKARLVTAKSVAGAGVDGDHYYGVSEFSIVILAFLLYSLLLTMYRGVALYIFKALFYSYVATKLEQTHDVNVVRYMKFGGFIFYLYLAILVYGFVSDIFDNSFSRELLLPAIFVGILIYALWRRLILLLIAYLASNSVIATRIIFHDNLSKSALVLLLAPISLLSLSQVSPFEQIVEYIGVSLIVGMIIHLLFKQIVTFNSLNVSFFQLILYLCATEFIPISSIYVIITRFLG